MSRSRFIALALAIGVCACSGEQPVEPGDDVTARTERASYLAGQPLFVDVHNASDRAVLLPRCDNEAAVTIDRRIGEAWTEASTRAIVCLGIYPSGFLLLVPGEHLRDRFVLADTGTYRLRYPVTEDLDEPAAGEVVSNVFVVEGR